MKNSISPAVEEDDETRTAEDTKNLHGLLGRRSAGRMTIVKDSRTKDLLDILDEQSKTLIGHIYDFFSNPNSSIPAQIWCNFATVLVLLRLLAIGLESADGPNQYTNRPDMSRYPFLLTADQYRTVDVALMLPLTLDAGGRLFILTLIYFGDENRGLYARFASDVFSRWMFFFEIAGVIPFIITAIYIRPKNVHLDEAFRVILLIFELMITGHIMRLVQNIPAIMAIRVAIGRSGPHLVVPIFFFMVFNCTAAVFFYFVEPCYNLQTCPWQDLFHTSFYSVVTMTTTGYGNQVLNHCSHFSFLFIYFIIYVFKLVSKFQKVPSYELARFVACCVMVFGALFMSMPLALIGNEYDDAWHDIEVRVCCALINNICSSCVPLINNICSAPPLSFNDNFLHGQYKATRAEAARLELLKEIKIELAVKNE